MQIGTQFTVFLVNQPGVLARVTEALAREKVNVAALALMDSGEHGALRIVCDEAAPARRVLQASSERWTETEVLVVNLENRPGAFHELSARLAAAGVNISYAYFSGGRDSRTTTAVFKVPDPARARDILRAAADEGTG